MVNKKIESFKDLEAWKKGHEIVMAVYLLSKQFPKDEIFCLTNQLRRAVISVTSNIAEGFSRQSLKEKIQFYSVALGSLTEAESQLLVARDLAYISPDEYQNIEVDLIIEHKLICGLIKYLRNS